MQVVRPDGRISLQLVGEVEAKGLTPTQLTDNLKELYGAHLRYPEVTVILREIRQRRVYVSGAVQRPGLVELPGELTLFEAIAEAGGFDLRTAETGSVLVVRHDDSGKRVGYKVNLKPMLKGEMSDPFYLQPQDIIYVPRTAITDVNQFIDQYINQVIPRTGFFYSAPVGNGTMGIDTSSR
jgi:protein involved in polysaccharide export with SLBB domain